MTTPGQPVDRVFVEVLPDFDKFGERLFAGIERDLAKLRLAIQAHMRGIEGDVDRSFRGIGNTMTREVNKAKRDVGALLDAIGGDTDRTGNRFTRFIRSILSSIGGTFSSAFRKAGEVFGEFGKALGNIFEVLSSGPTKFIAIGLAIVPLLSLITGLGAVLSNVVGIVGILPSSLAVAVAAFAPLLIAFHGFGDALSAAFSGDPEKFKEALKGVTPAAQEILKDIAGLKTAFTDLRRRVQEAFFSPLVDDVDKFAANLLTPLTDGLVIVSRELGGLISDILGSLSSPRGAQFLQEVFQTTADILHSMRPAILELAKGFGNVAEAALPIVRELSEKLAGVLTDFGEFLSRSAKDGSLEKFIRDALDALKDLGAFLKSIGSVVAALFGDESSQEAGKKLLADLTEGFKNLAEFLKSDAGKDFLKFLAEDLDATVNAVRNLGLAIGIVIVAVTDFTGAVHELIDELIDLWKKLTEGADSAKTGVLQSMTDLATGLIGLGGLFFFAGEALSGSFAKGFGTGAGSALGSVKDSFVNSVRSGLNGLIGSINKGISLLDTALIFTSLPRIPLLAQGGLAFGPSIIGEAGRELAVPLNNPSAQEAIRQALGGAAGGVTIEAGAVQVVFQGVMPTRQQAFDVGQQVADGIAAFMARRDARTAARSL